MSYAVGRRELMLASLFVLAGCDALFRLTAVPPLSDAAISRDSADSAIPVADGLVAYYPFEDVTTACAVDATGHGHDGTCMQGGAFGAPRLVSGKLGMAAAFDSHVSIVVADSGDFEHGGFTVASWLYLPSTAGSIPFECAFARPFADNYSDHWAVCVQPSQIQYVVDSSFLFEMPGLPQDEWHHVALTWSGSLMTVWFDGALVASGPATMEANPEAIVIGSDIDPAPDGVDNFFPGYIDDLRLYSRPLDPTEISELALR